MRVDNFDEYAFEKTTRANKINRKAKNKFKPKNHFGEGKKLREEVEQEEDPISEYYESLNS